VSRLGASVAIVCATALVATAAQAQTVDELKRELAVKKAYISKLEKRLRELERRPARVEPVPIGAPAPAVAAAPARVPPPPPPPAEEDEMDRALERTRRRPRLGLMK
jgi:uncharacterized coiled-coil protein SlyX